MANRPLPDRIDPADCDPWTCHWGEDDGSTPVVLWVCDYHASQQTRAVGERHGAAQDGDGGVAERHRCVFVSDDGTFRVVEFTADDDRGTLTPLQHLVDGYIERVVGAVAPLNGGRPEAVDIWVNEHGRFRPNFEPNFAILALLPKPTLLVGPAVVTIINNEGDTCGLSEHLIDAVRGALTEVGAGELPVAGFEEAASQQETVRQNRPRPARRATSDVQS